MTLKVASNHGSLTKEYVELLKLLEGDPGNNEHKIIHYANLSIVETTKSSFFSSNKEVDRFFFLCTRG